MNAHYTNGIIHFRWITKEETGGFVTRTLQKYLHEATHFVGTYSGSSQTAVWFKAKNVIFLVYLQLASNALRETNCGPAAKIYHVSLYGTRTISFLRTFKLNACYISNKKAGGFFPGSPLHRARKESKEHKHIVQKASTLPETTRASFGPTVWQFPILPTEKTRIQAHSTHTTVICLEIHVFFPPTLDCRWFFFSTRGKSDSCVKSYLTRRYTSASDFHNRGASWRGLFKIIVLVLFWRTHRHACGLLLLLAWLSWSDTPPPVPTPSAAAEGYDITIMKRAWLFK